MTTEQIRQLHRARPFRPFSMHMADGRNVLVYHPEFMHFSPSGRMVFVSQPDETMNFVDLLLVTDLELKPDAVVMPKNTNGPVT